MQSTLMNYTLTHSDTTTQLQTTVRITNLCGYTTKEVFYSAILPGHTKYGKKFDIRASLSKTAITIQVSLGFVAKNSKKLLEAAENARESLRNILRLAKIHQDFHLPETNPDRDNVDKFTAEFDNYMDYLVTHSEDLTNTDLLIDSVDEWYVE